MKIDFSKDRCQNWREVIQKQYDEYYVTGDIDNWCKWLEVEWNCRIITISINEIKMIDSFEFTDKGYLMAILRYGPPD